MSDGTHLQVELSTVALTQYASGFLGVQPVPLGDGGTMQAMPAYHPTGMIARPRDPDAVNGVPTTAANCLVAWEGQRGHSIPLGPDPRVVPKLPPVNKGGALLYADRDDGKVTFLNLDGTSGGVTLYVPYGSSSMCIDINLKNAGAESIQVRHGAGMGISMTAGGKNSLILNNSKGDAYIEVNDDGINLSGKITHVGNFSAGYPGPTEVPGVPAVDAVVLSTQFQVWATALLASAQAWAAQVVAQCAANTPPIVVPPLTLTPFEPTSGTSTKFKAA